MRLGQAEHALADAKACRTLRPNWPKACYREGAALRLLQASSHVPPSGPWHLKQKFSSLWSDVSCFALTIAEV